MPLLRDGRFSRWSRIWLENDPKNPKGSYSELKYVMGLHRFKISIIESPDLFQKRLTDVNIQSLTLK